MRLSTPPDPARYQSECGGKVMFRAKAMARVVARERSDESGHVFKAYRCAYCRLWHIGHPIGLHRRRAS